jgi:hypothetical protein
VGEIGAETSLGGSKTCRSARACGVLAMIEESTSRPDRTVGREFFETLTARDPGYSAHFQPADFPATPEQLALSAYAASAHLPDRPCSFECPAVIGQLTMPKHLK